MNRRQFVCTVLASATQLRASAKKYDLVIRNGRLIDPSVKLNATRDVGIREGRIASIEPHISGDAVEVIDATGKLVVPGLIDIHTHAARTSDGTALCLKDGVTALLDAGSRGADNIDPWIVSAKSAPQLCRVLINISRSGNDPAGDTLDINKADVNLAREAIMRHRDMIVGVKSRLSPELAGPNDYESLRRAQEVATPFHLPVMIHMGQTVSPLSKLMPLLKSGDIVTHMFAPPPHGILDDNGNILPEVLAARHRGVKFDLGNGRNRHLRWDIAEAVMKKGFLPDTLSTDWVPEGVADHQITDLPNVLSKFLTLGMTLDQVIACATVNSSRIFPVFHNRGTLKPGSPADVAILELREGKFEFVDNYGNQRNGSQRLFPSATILAGKRVATR
jgi:dihydroorotase